MQRRNGSDFLTIADFREFIQSESNEFTLVAADIVIDQKEIIGQSFDYTHKMFVSVDRGRLELLLFNDVNQNQSVSKITIRLRDYPPSNLADHPRCTLIDPVKYRENSQKVLCSDRHRQLFFVAQNEPRSLHFIVFETDHSCLRQWLVTSQIVSCEFLAFPENKFEAKLLMCGGNAYVMVSLDDRHSLYTVFARKVVRVTVNRAEQFKMRPSGNVLGSICQQKSVYSCFSVSKQPKQSYYTLHHLKFRCK